MFSSIIVRVVYEGTTYDLDIESDIPIRLDVSAIENTQIGEIFGIGSQIFDIPGTSTNNQFFRHAYNIGAEDVPAFSNTIDGYIISNGESILKGQFQLIEIIKDEQGYVVYKCQLTDETIQFKDAIQNKLITNGDWGEYEHTLNVANITGSWQNQLLDGKVYYPVVDYGYDDPESQGNYPLFSFGEPDPSNSGNIVGNFFNNSSTPIQPQQFLPSVRAKDTLEVICAQAGFSASGDFINSGYFSNLFLLPKAKEGIGIVITGSEEATAFAQNSYNQIIPSHPSGSGFTTLKPLAADNILSDPQNKMETSGSQGYIQYNATGIGAYEASTGIGFFNPVSFSSAAVKVELQLMRGTFPFSGTVIAEEEIELSSQNGFNTFQLNAGGGWTSTSQQDVWANVRYTHVSGPTPSDLNLIGINSNLRISVAPETYNEATVDMSKQWPADLKSIDILQCLIQQFNLVVYPSPTQDKTILFEQFDEWIKKGRLKDWTDKWDTAVRVGIKHTIDEEPQEIILGNMDDSDRFSVEAKESDPFYQYGTLRVLADNNISQGSKSIKNAFGPTILGGPFVSGSLTQEGVPTYNIDLASSFAYPHLYKFENNQIKSFKFRTRIGFKSNNTFPSGSDKYRLAIGNNNQDRIIVTDSYGTLSNVNGLPARDGDADLHFNNTYFKFAGPGLNLQNSTSNFDTYWKTYIDSLYWNDSRKVTLDVLFSPEEYKDIELNDIIFIKDQRYRINKISGYNLTSTDVATVELIRLYPAYSGQVKCDFDYTLEESDGSFRFEAIQGLPAPTPTPTVEPTPTATPVPSATPTPTPTTFPIDTNNCLTYNFVNNSNSNQAYDYVECGTQNIVFATANNNTSFSHCIVSGSVSNIRPLDLSRFEEGTSVALSGDSQFTVTTGSSCSPVCTNYEIFNLDNPPGIDLYYNYTECGTGYQLIGGPVAAGTTEFQCSVVDPTWNSGAGGQLGFGLQPRGACPTPTPAPPTPTPSSTPTSTPTPTVSPTQTPTPTAQGFSTRTIQGLYNVGSYGPCTQGKFQGPLYINSNVSYVQIGDVLYTDINLTNKLSGMTHFLETDTQLMWEVQASSTNVGEVLSNFPPCPTPVPSPTPTATLEPFVTSSYAFTNSVSNLCNEINQGFTRGTYGITTIGKTLYLDNGTTKATGWNYFRDEVTGNIWYLASQTDGVITSLYGNTTCPTPTPSPTPTPTPEVISLGGVSGSDFDQDGFAGLCENTTAPDNLVTGSAWLVKNSNNTSFMYKDAGLTQPWYGVVWMLDSNNKGYYFSSENQNAKVNEFYDAPVCQSGSAIDVRVKFNATFTDFCAGTTNSSYDKTVYITASRNYIEDYDYIYENQSCTELYNDPYKVIQEDSNGNVWNVYDPLYNSPPSGTRNYGQVFPHVPSQCPPIPTSTPTPTATPSFNTFTAAFTNQVNDLCNETNQGFTRGTYGPAAVGKTVYWSDGGTKATGWNYIRNETTGEVWYLASKTNGIITSLYNTVVCPTPTPTPTATSTPTPTPTGTPGPSPTPTPSSTPTPTPTPTSTDRWIRIEGELCTQVGSGNVQIYNWYGTPSNFTSELFYDANSGWCMDAYYFAEGRDESKDDLDCSSRFEYYETCSDCQSGINEVTCT